MRQEYSHGMETQTPSTFSMAGASCPGILGEKNAARIRAKQGCLYQNHFCRRRSGKALEGRIV